AANSPLYVVRAFRTVGLAVSESIWLMWFDGSGCDCLLVIGHPERAARPRVDGGPQRQIRHSLDRRRPRPTATLCPAEDQPQGGSNQAHTSKSCSTASRAPTGTLR